MLIVMDIEHREFVVLDTLKNLIEELELQDAHKFIAQIEKGF